MNSPIRTLLILIAITLGLFVLSVLFAPLWTPLRFFNWFRLLTSVGLAAMSFYFLLWAGPLPFTWGEPRLRWGLLCLALSVVFYIASTALLFLFDTSNWPQGVSGIGHLPIPNADFLLHARLQNTNMRVINYAIALYVIGNGLCLAKAAPLRKFIAANLFATAGLVFIYSTIAVAP